jgi:hypothetical protein
VSRTSYSHMAHRLRADAGAPPIRRSRPFQDIGRSADVVSQNVGLHSAAAISVWLEPQVAGAMGVLGSQATETMLGHVFFV